MHPICTLRNRGIRSYWIKPSRFNPIDLRQDYYMIGVGSKVSIAKMEQGVQHRVGFR